MEEYEEDEPEEDELEEDGEETERETGDCADFEEWEDIDPESAGSNFASSSVGFKAKEVAADSIEVANQIFKQKFNVTGSFGVAAPVRLAPRHFSSRTPEELASLESKWFFEPGEIDALGRALATRRLLVLCGEPESGKGCAALLLASRLRKVQSLRKVLTCQGLSSSIRVDLEKLAWDRGFRGQAILFEDALAGENADLRSFVKTIDEDRLAVLEKRLASNKSVVILTSSVHTLAKEGKRLESLGILKRISPPSQALLAKSFRDLAKRLTLSAEHRELVTAVVDGRCEEIAQALRTIPRVGRFVNEYLLEVAKGEVPLQDALARMDDLSKWLSDDLASDLDAQAAVLALVLGSPVPPAVGLPWLEFEALRRKVNEALRRALRLAEDGPHTGAPLGSSSLLERARAHLVGQPKPAADLVRFRDDRYSAQLWRALLGPARELGAVLLPVLFELLDEGDRFLHAIAASALGRLGELSPSSLAMPYLRRWAESGGDSRDTMGHFLRGSRGSEDGSYQQICLEVIRGLAGEEEVEPAVAAVHGLRFLGDSDLAAAIRELMFIARTRLPIRLEMLRSVDRDVLEAEAKLREAVDPGSLSREISFLHGRSYVFFMAALVPGDRMLLVGAAQYSLAGILFSQGGDPTPVLKELSHWMGMERTKLAPLVAYLFLHPHGLFDLLERHRWYSVAAEGEYCSRFLLGASLSEETLGTLRQFLEKVFAALEIFPSLFRSLLEARLSLFLIHWCQEGCRVLSLRATVIQLLLALLASKDERLKKLVQDLLRHDRRFLARGSRMLALALDVLGGTAGGPIPGPSRSPRRLPARLAPKGQQEA